MPAEKTMDEKQSRRRRRQVEEEIEEAEDTSEDEELEDRGFTERKGRATPGRRGQVEVVEEGNVVTRPISRLRNYLEDVRSELSKVTWPTRQETRDLTWILLATTIAAAIILGAISAVFTALFRIGIDTPAILIAIIIIAIAVAVYYIRASNKRTPSF